MQTFQNNLNFSLYTTLSVCYMVATLGVEQSPRKVSADNSILLKNTENGV